MSEHFQKRMNEVTAETGNVVDGRGKPFSEDTFLDTIEVLALLWQKRIFWIPKSRLW
jgi:hypothetical protein